jgi:hypothetical protein
MQLRRERAASICDFRLSSIGSLDDLDKAQNDSDRCVLKREYYRGMGAADTCGELQQLKQQVRRSLSTLGFEPKDLPYSFLYLHVEGESSKTGSAHVPMNLGEGRTMPRNTEVKEFLVQTIACWILALLCIGAGVCAPIPQDIPTLGESL